MRVGGFFLRIRTLLAATTLLLASLPIAAGSAYAASAGDVAITAQNVTELPSVGTTFESVLTVRNLGPDLAEGAMVYGFSEDDADFVSGVSSDSADACSG